LNPPPSATTGDLTIVLCILFVVLTPLAVAGLVLINAGLGRSRNAAHVMTASLCATAIATLTYFAIGFGIQGHDALQPQGWNWIGHGPFFLRGLRVNELPVILAAWLQFITVGLASVIALGGGAERWRLGSICLSTALLSAITYPLFAHWVWGGGWLAQHGFVDAAGSGVIQCTGGLTALAITWLLGPRRGKFGQEGMPAAIPGHNIVVVMFGCIVTMAGWTALNEAGAMLNIGAPIGSCPIIALNTLFAGGSGLLAAVVVTRLRFGKPDASLSANGMVAGLVASSASCPLIPPPEAIIIGFVAGALVVYSIELFELRLGVDDPTGSASVHGVGGIWGLLALGIFGRRDGQFISQLVGIATLIGFVFPLTYGINWILNRISPMRIAQEGEWQGLDLYELGAGAYPEFVSHGEEFAPR
jgi:Amt family ammonium transporter